MINKENKRGAEDIPIQKPIPQKINYKYAGKESLTQTISRITPPQLIPSKRYNMIFEGIFILVLIIALFQFPFSSLFAGNAEITIKIGYPLTFLELELTESENMPIKFFGLILDLIIYVILAYAIDISINLILKNPLVQSEEEIKRRPTVFKNKKISIAESAVKKISKRKV